MFRRGSSNPICFSCASTGSHSRYNCWYCSSVNVTPGGGRAGGAARARDAGEAGAAAAMAARGEGEKEEGDICERSVDDEVVGGEAAMGTGLETDLYRGDGSRRPLPLPPRPPPTAMLPPLPEPSESTHEKSAS